MKKHALNENLKTFLNHIDSIRDTLPMTMLLLEPFSVNAGKDFIEFYGKNIEETKDEKGEKKLLVKTDNIKMFENLQNNFNISMLALKIIPDSLFVSLISQYDAFFTRLLREIFNLNPEILNGSDKNLKFSQIVEMNSIEDAREYIIEKEIDTVLRKNHTEQFEYLEKRLNIKLREKLPIWKTFIEVTERRNLLVHCDGMISNQYLDICKKHRCSLKGKSIGERLSVDPEYFSKAYKCLYEISTKLTHTIWRKLAENEIENADLQLNEICFNLIITESFSLADILLKFANDQQKVSNESQKSIFIVNQALSMFLQDKKGEAKKILDQKDWSASQDVYRLAYEVLTDNYEKSYELMIKIGSEGDLTRSAYKEWPLFTKIRTENKFKDTYFNIFNEKYTVMETPLRPIEKLINEKKEKPRKRKDGK